MKGERPPRFARWLLRLRPLGSRRAEVEADLEELFVQRAAREGRLRARRRYFVDVLSVWRWNPTGARVFQEAAQDLKYGLRVFRRTPGAVAVTTAGLALAIGVSTAVFSIVNGTLLMRLGVADPESAVRVNRAWSGGVSHGWSYAEYLALRESSRDTRIEATGLLREAARFTRDAPTVRDNPQMVPMEVVSGTFMETFGARPLYGRLLASADDAAGQPPVAVVGYTFWMRHLDADPSVVGRPVWLNGMPVTIAGVLDRSFNGLNDYPPAFWMTFNGQRATLGDEPLAPGSRMTLSIVARRPPQLTAAQAEAQVSALASAVGRDSPDPYRATGVRFLPADQRFTGRNAATVVLIAVSVLVAIALVVLLACLNVANLQLASAFARQREIGIRLALGASRARIVRQLVTESVALGLAGGATALAIAMWLVPVFTRALNMPETYDVAPDGRAYAFLLIVSAIAGVGAGLAPARHGARGDVLTPLKGDGPRLGSSGRPGRLRAALIGVQAAASLLLLVVAVLTARGAMRAARIDVGFDASRLIAVAPGFGRMTEAQTAAYLDLALERLRAVPGVRAASLTDMPPFSGGYIGTAFERGGHRQRAFLAHTASDYFSTLGLRILRGRMYTDAEVAARAPVTVVSEALAHHLSGGQDPIGLVLDEFDYVDKAPRVTVIGVVSDASTAWLHDARPMIYRPLARVQTSRILVRTDGQPLPLLPLLRASLQTIEPRLRVDLSLVNDGLQREVESPRMLASLSAAVAALALALAVIGIYGVTSFVMGQRTREVGVRLAVGGSRADVLRLLLRDSLRPIVIGLLAGIGLALLAARAFRGVMYGLTAQDPMSLVTAALVLLFAATAAVCLPTWRASRLDPASVLRQS